MDKSKYKLTKKKDRRQPRRLNLVEAEEEKKERVPSRPIRHVPRLNLVEADELKTDEENKEEKKSDPFVPRRAPRLDLVDKKEEKKEEKKEKEHPLRGARRITESFYRRKERRYAPVNLVESKIVDVLPNNMFIATRDFGRYIEVWDSRRMVNVYNIELPASVSNVVSTLGINAARSQIVVTDPIKGAVVTMRGDILTDFAHSCADAQFSPDDASLAVVGGNTLTIYNTANWEPLSKNYNPRVITGVSWLGGSHLAISSSRGEILIVSKDDSKYDVLQNPRPFNVRIGLSTSPNENLLISYDSLGLLSIYNVSTRQLLYSYKCINEREVYARDLSRPQWSSTGKYIVVQTNKGIKICEMASTGEMVKHKNISTPYQVTDISIVMYKNEFMMIYNNSIVLYDYERKTWRYPRRHNHGFNRICASSNPESNKLAFLLGLEYE